MKTYMISALAIAALVPSCASLEGFATLLNPSGGAIQSNQVGVAEQVLPASVIAVENVVLGSTNTTKNVGTGVGAALGLGAGQLLGKGSGRVASSVGFAAAGALAGRYLASAQGKSEGQRITVQLDGTQQNFTFVQAVDPNIGYISVGMHGTYYHSSKARFVPEGVGSYTE